MINLKKWLLILVGSFTWSLTMVKSGLHYPFGLGFWGANGHDGVWHIALAESLSRGMFENPVFSNFKIQNYHIGFDLALGFLAKITNLTVINLYFQILPPILAILIGVLTYKFVKEWTNSDGSAFWSVFFVYFGGSLGFLIGKGESAFWSQQSISTLINPPFALSLILILLGLSALIKYEKLKSKRSLILSILFFGVLSSIKIYAALLTLLGLFLICVYRYVKNKDKSFFVILIGVFVLSLAFYLPLNKSSQSMVIWQPFWFLETMMGTSDRLGWDRFYSAMSTYKSGHVWLKFISAYSVAFAIFWIGNMGTRIINGFIVLKWSKNHDKFSWVNLFVVSVILAGGMVPLLFLQKGTPWNTIQFFYYSLFFSGILAGVSLNEILKLIKKPVSRNIILGIILFLTLPTTYLTLNQVYIPSRPPAKVSTEELSALDFLSTQPQGVVLTFPFDSSASKAAEAFPPRPLHLYVSTAYVSAFSRHQVYLEDEVNLDITGYDWRVRRKQIEDWYKESDSLKARAFLKDNNIKYIYWVKGQRALLGEGQLGLSNIYENNSSTVYRVD